MLLRARLAHADSGQRVVEVSAWDDGRCLGSALGEAPTAEAAEDRALQRLLRRLQDPARLSQPIGAHQPAAQPDEQPAPPASPPAVPAPAPAQTPAPAPPPSASSAPAPALETTAPPGRPAAAEAEPLADPDDWSEELAELERLLRQLGWEREQESIYLERAFGHPSRSRLIRYADLLAYLGALRRLEPGVDPVQAALPLRRADLLRSSDVLLARLGWGAAEGRALLERDFNLASRQQLSDDDLLRFNALLAQRLEAPTAPCPEHDIPSPAGPAPG
ncbi:hypothetical protein KBZ18_03885 [Synechococcus sp. Cruz-9H2]|uniref:hypothetical protein n=1 Tax=unclassified Synechococcus TaxID=2626047 RepID=UPI0020CF2AE0|nr:MULTISPECIES: hypothetical protein [unclassified Synechococcus]MCP9818634.1 hypothetical protein [Synechococcus sp. Cruz-9H2]MCP9842864.1 hypothetical protein [Synechococcus sp. Edmonson 11F2]MCP9855889.1 hypothetical protein [Synechococcus sp. Cruz-9C9]MCP9862224.1 hypothetical protein [Synechococcus sp. Cruz-7E5]MCP9869495.1 hypothetical protein [Synechococcus sp. Cruz-7B9]